MSFFIDRVARLLLTIRYINLHRLFNLYKIILSYFYSRLGKVKNFGHRPYFISIEPANFCNLECKECPVGQRVDSNYPNTKLDQALYHKLIDELKSTLFHVIFYFQGEPFLNQQLCEMIAFAHKAKLYTSTSTNGHFITDQLAEQIVRSGLDKLIVSVDGATQEVYEQYRVGGSLEKVCAGVKSLVAWKKALKSPTPLIEIQFIVFKSNEDQMEEMKSLTKRLGADRLRFKTAQLYNFENGNSALTTIDRYARYKKTANGRYALKSAQPNHCLRLWSAAVVTARGEVLPCCFDKNSDFSFGNIKDQSFGTQWQNKKAFNFRTSILHNRKQFEMCRNCTSK
jgi:radical SAM protein with 4Fe4S-binding SPASM domain